MARSARELVWYSRYQPDTLRAAVALLYLNAVLSLFWGLILGIGVSAIFILVDVAAGIGIANSRKWAYLLGVVAAVLPIVFIVTEGVNFGEVLNLLFYVALVVLLVHPQSRHFIRTYFH